MDGLRYYEDLSRGVLLAYEESVEFFVAYIPKTKEWTDCGISFLKFRHDYAFREVCREEALEKTDGNLPEEMLRRYIDMINGNKKFLL